MDTLISNVTIVTMNERMDVLFGAYLGITDGKNATCYPGCETGMGNANVQANAACVRDGNLITGTSAGCAIPFGLALVEALKGKEMADTIARQIVIR